MTPVLVHCDKQGRTKRNRKPGSMPRLGQKGAYRRLNEPSKQQLLEQRAYCHSADNYEYAEHHLWMFRDQFKLLMLLHLVFGI